MLQCKLLSTIEAARLPRYGVKLFLCIFINLFFLRSQDLKWMEALYSTGQRLGKIAEPVAGDLNIIQFLPKSHDSTFPLNVIYYFCY